MERNRFLAAAATGVVPIQTTYVAANIGLLSDVLPGISAAFKFDHNSVRKLEPAIAENLSKHELGANSSTH